MGAIICISKLVLLLLFALGVLLGAITMNTFNKWKEIVYG